MLLITGAAPASGQAHAHGDKKTAEVTPSRAAFEQLKRMEGKWKGRSTKGWEETITYKTIAAGSVVVGNSFDAHPVRIDSREGIFQVYTTRIELKEWASGLAGI